MRAFAALLVLFAACAHADATRGLEGAGCQSDRDCTYGLVCRGASDRRCTLETFGECAKAADCFPGRTCRNGQCTVQCVTDAGCGKDRRCDVGECVSTSGPPPCLLPGDCPVGQECLAGRCVKAERMPCVRDFDCGPLERCVAGVCR